MPYVRALLSACLVTFAASPSRAAPVTLENGRALLESGSFDDLYLSFSSLASGEHPEGDAGVTTLLLDGAQAALESGDAPLALGLSDAARRISPRSVEACVVNADALVALDQRAAAEAALDAALKLQPGNWELVYRRADYAQQEGQPALAVKLFRRVPKSHTLHEQAVARARRLERAMQEETQAFEQMKVNEAAQRQKQAQAARTAGTGPVTARPPPAASPTAAVPDGMTGRSSRNFHIAYQPGARDFAERADYETRVLALFEKAYADVKALLGRGTENPVEVVLYTEEEFRFHFGQMFGGGVVGFYSGKIRMNRADTLDAAFESTVVHEFVHAVVDDVTRGADVPVWLNEGLARWVERRVTGSAFITQAERAELLGLSRQGLLPKTTSLTGAFTSLGPFVGAAYAQSATAVEALSRPHGVGRVVQVLEGLGRGESVDEAFSAVFGTGRLAGVDDEIAKLIAR